MAFFTVNTAEDNVKDFSGDGGNYLNKSGIYECIVKHAIVDVSAKGSKSINLFIEHNGQEQMLFQAMRLTNNDGTENLGAKLFTKFCIVAGADNGAEIADPVSMMLPVGKDKEEKECMVLEQFDNTPIFLRLQMEYSLYEGKIQAKKNVRNFFRFEDKATAAEIVNNSEEKGSQYEKELELADRVTYKDDLTEEDIENWIKSNRSGGKEKTATKTPAAGFGGKRTFGKKS